MKAITAILALAALTGCGPSLKGPATVCHNGEVYVRADLANDPMSNQRTCEVKK